MSEPPHKAEVVLLGCGAIGLPLGVALASQGRRVLGVDIDPTRIEQLNAGATGLIEEGLDAAFGRAVSNGCLRFATRLIRASEPRIFVIAVPTPANAAGLDATALDGAMASILAAASPGDLVCIRSTVPIGKTRALADSATHLAFAACPDRSLSGRVYAEQFTVPHLVGGVDDEAGDRAEAMLRPLGPVVRTPDPETAEAIKLFANVERDVTFALANQFSLICGAAGLDSSTVWRAAGEGFPRFRLARPGPVGGPCLTKDVYVLAASASLVEQNLSLLRAARELNESLAGRLAADILALPTPGPVAILGLAFKGSPPTNDARHGFAGLLAEALTAAAPETDIRAWDPVITPDAASREAALRGASVVVLANDHPDLVDVADFAELLRTDAVVYDTTGLLAGAAPLGVAVLGLGAGGGRPGPPTRA